MIKGIIFGILISMLPVLEVRGGIPLAIAYGVHPVLAFIFCAAANILSVFILFYILDKLNDYFMKKSTFYNRIMNRYIERYRDKVEKALNNNEEFLYLLAFVAIPLPFTGSWTGTIVAWLFDIKRKTAIKAIVTGIVIASLLVTLASVGVFSLF